MYYMIYNIILFHYYLKIYILTELNAWSRSREKRLGTLQKTVVLAILYSTVYTQLYDVEVLLLFLQIGEGGIYVCVLRVGTI